MNTQFLSRVTIAALLASLGAFSFSAPMPKAKFLKERATLRGHRSTVFTVAFSPDGKALASAGCDGTVRLWDVRTGKNTATFPVGGEFIYAVAFSPDGKLLASGNEKDIRLWDVASGKNTATLKGATYVTSLAFGPDRDTLASGSDNTARVWDLKTHKVRSSLKVGSLYRQNGVAYSRAGKLLVADSGFTNVNLWDTATGKKSFTLKVNTEVAALGFSPDGKFLASGGGAPRTVQVWDVATGKSTATFKVADQITCLAFSADGRFLAYAHRSPGPPPGDGWIRLVDLTARREVAAFEGKDSVMFMLAFSPTDGLLASCDVKGVIKLWDVPTPAKAPR